MVVCPLSNVQTQLGLDRSSDGWLLVEGQSPSDSSGRRFLRGVVYSLSRLSTALGLTGGDEDDSQYKQRVMRSGWSQYDCHVPSPIWRRECLLSFVSM